MRKYSFLVFLFISSKIFAQCEAILPFTEKSMEQIHDVYQFTFLHKEPQNKLDSLVLQLMYPSRVIDSNYFDWNYSSPRVQSVIDLFNYRKVLDELALLKTNEAFLILHLYYLIPSKIHDDLNPFLTFCANINYFGGAVAINKHYLKNAISTDLGFTEFNHAVFERSLPLLNEKIKGIKYCKPLQGDAALLHEMKQSDPAPYDSAIEQILNKYLNRLPNQKTYFSMDSIIMEVFQLPTFADAIWDNCIAQVASPDGNSYYQLGVIFNIGKDRDNQNKYLQRVYTVQNSQSNGQILVDKRFHADFVSLTRRKCEGYDE